MLSTKHPDALSPTAAILDTYPDHIPELVPVGITNDTVTEVAGQFFIGAGTGGADSLSLKH